MAFRLKAECVAGAVERVKKIRDYAFVHFTQREDAINAMNTLNGKVDRVFISCQQRNGRQTFHDQEMRFCFVLLCPAGGRLAD